MTRKKRRAYDNSQRQQSAIAGPCQCVMCVEHRKKANAPGKTSVYAVRGRVRYCRCDFCGATWKTIVETKHS